MHIDLPSLYGEEWLNKVKSKKSGEFNKHFNPRNMKKGKEGVTFNDLEQIKNIAFVDKNIINENPSMFIYLI
jgi:hypothetical protein